MPRGIPNNPAARRTTMLLNAAKNAQREGSSESFVDADTQEMGLPNGVRVARSGYGRMAVYVLTPTGCVRRAINVQSVNDVLEDPKYAFECFDCGRDDCMYATEVRGETSTNECKGKASRQYRICPEGSCRKRIYDTRPTGKFSQDEFDHSRRDDTGDPNVIGNEDLGTVSPADFTLSKMELHVIAFHPELARTMNLKKAEELPRLAVV